MKMTTKDTKKGKVTSDVLLVTGVSARLRRYYRLQTINYRLSS